MDRDIELLFATIGDERWICGVCGRVFKSHADLARHDPVHTRATLIEHLQLGDPEDAPDTIQDRFERFHAANPWVYLAMVDLTREWVQAGHRRLGIGMLQEVLRWQYGLRTHGDEFKLNDHFRSRYVRLLITEHPEFSDLFETRRLRSA
jgi:hypothetical protein